ncbi:MAG: UDP-N-acetylmuramate dehydrogenase [Candidatus Edwardsbacteria bacterium]|nr:UDP-N-acetylmuramate dehydrogenase [Candidatus Edwardsbacteria bacterium]
MKKVYWDIIAGLSCEYRIREPLYRHTSFKIGGPADLMVFPRNQDELAAILSQVTASGLAPLVLGNGTNLLAGDKGFRGVVIKLTKGFKAIAHSGAMIEVGAGHSLSRLVDFCLASGLSGMEWAVGIPGSVGGALVMNAGAYGGQMSDVATIVRGLIPTGNKRLLKAKSINFSYRHAEYPEGFVITGCTLKMKRGRPQLIKKAMDELMAKRAFNQPLSQPSAGCIFKNPANDSARRLIGLAGLKGKRVGGAQVSVKHANFIVNRGGATARDVMKLARQIQIAVKRELGVALAPEVRLIGER